VRQVVHIGRRLNEAARLGFTHAVVPPRTEPVAGLELFPVETVRQAFAVCGVTKGVCAVPDR
jgi:DNA repair protein RadA/Sms